MLNEITVEMNDKPPSIDSNSSDDYSREEEKWTKKHNGFLQKFVMIQKMHLLNII